jgi:AraC-like DNA-binding protein
MVGLLADFPVARTGDVDELRSTLAILFQDSKFDIGSDRKPISSYVNYCPLQHTAIMYGSYGAAIDASFGELQFYVQGVTISGTGELSINRKTMSADVGGLLSPHARQRLRFDHGFEHLALKIEKHALTRKLGAIVGISPTKPIIFEVDSKFDRPAAKRLRRVISFLAGELSSKPMNFSAVALAETEQALMTWFLVGNRHNYSHLLDERPRSVAPWQVRRVEEHIEASWDQPLTVEELATIAETSARSVFHAFKQSRGYSPMDFLRQIRLQRAWRMLTSSDGDVSVTEVAYACGFGNLGHFARYFRTKYGEAPSAVLSRARRLRKNSDD